MSIPPTERQITVDHDDEQQEETATEEGLDNQAQELADKDTQDSGDQPDPRDPAEWREMPKEGGGA